MRKIKGDLIASCDFFGLHNLCGNKGQWGFVCVNVSSHFIIATYCMQSITYYDICII